MKQIITKKSGELIDISEDSCSCKNYMGFAKIGASFKLSLKFCLNQNKSSFSATTAATADWTGSFW